MMCGGAHTVSAHSLHAAVTIQPVGQVVHRAHAVFTSGVQLAVVHCAPATHGVHGEQVVSLNW